MFQEPPKYTSSDHFFFQEGQELEIVCNAPTGRDGVFKIIELCNGKVTLVFIGYSNSGGLFNEIVNGLHYDRSPRKLGLPYQLLKDNIDAIDVYWYAIPPEINPKKVQSEMLKNYIDQTGRFPKWNK
ncbi:MAG: hypothetical protein H6605_02440 [Flavobacteriales bacterium]|nr:hypothetical protein [Flavobacteriales bacterium]